MIAEDSKSKSYTIVNEYFVTAKEFYILLISIQIQTSFWDLRINQVCIAWINIRHQNVRNAHHAILEEIY